MNPIGVGRFAVIAGEMRVVVSQSGRMFRFECGRDEYERVWRRYFDLDADYAAYIDSVAADDAFMREAVAFGSGMRVLRQDPWEAAVSFVISQNNNIPRIKVLIERLCARYGRRCVSADGTAYHGFPTRDALRAARVDDVRALGAGYRDRYIVALARCDIDFAVLRCREDAYRSSQPCSASGQGRQLHPSTDCIIPTRSRSTHDPARRPALRAGFLVELPRICRYHAASLFYYGAGSAAVLRPSQMG